MQRTLQIPEFKNSSAIHSKLLVSGVVFLIIILSMNGKIQICSLKLLKFVEVSVTAADIGSVRKSL